MKQSTSTIIGAIVVTFVALIAVLADFDAALDFVREIPISWKFSLLLISLIILVLVVYSPFLYRAERKRAERKEKIDHLRACMARFGEPNCTNDTKEFIRSHKDARELIPYLSDEFREQINAYKPGQAEIDQNYPALISNFIDELDILSKKWKVSSFS